MAIPTTDSVQGQGVRTLNPGDVAAKIVDATTPTQGMAVDTSGRITIKLDDGAGNIITSQVNGSQRALDVGINVAGVQIDPRAIRALTASDIVTAVQGAAGTQNWLVTDPSIGAAAPGTAAPSSSLVGGLYVSAGVTLTTGQQSALQLTSTGLLKTSTVLTNDENYGVTSANTIRTASQIGNATGAADFNAGATSAQTLRTVANQGATGTAATAWFMKVTDGTNVQAIKAASTAAAATDTAAVVALSPNSPLPAGTNAIGSVLSNTQVGGNPVSLTNPMPVVLSSGLPGTQINSYFVSAANLAYGASDTHTYTITSGKTFNIKKIWASGSGRIRIDVAISTDGVTFNTVYTGYSSTVFPNIPIDFDIFSLQDSGTGAAVKITRYNEELGAVFSITSTISGTEN